MKNIFDRSKAKAMRLEYNICAIASFILVVIFSFKIYMFTANFNNEAALYLLHQSPFHYTWKWWILAIVSDIICIFCLGMANHFKKLIHNHDHPQRMTWLQQFENR